MAQRASSRSPKSLFSTVVAVGIVVIVAGFLFVDKVQETKAETGYTLRFPDTFKPWLASRDDLGISVVLAVDVSGSMGDLPASGGAAKYIQASIALGQVVDVLERLVTPENGGQVIKLGLMKFDEEIVEVLPLTVMDAESVGMVRELVSNPRTFLPGGSTAIGKAIETGVGALAQSGTILRSLIVVSDGVNTAGEIPELVLDAVYGNRNSAGTPELPVLTNSTLISFIGFDIDSGNFSKMADFGVRVTSAADREQLASVLSNLLEADITRLEASSLGGD